MRSVDASATWQKNNNVPIINKEELSNIEMFNILDIVMDPQDSNALYLISTQGDLWYTYSQANRWDKVPAFPNTLVTTLAVDPTSKCTLYASSGSKIFKSIDCSRSWTRVYTDSRPVVKINVLAIDPLNPTLIYAGLSSGDLLISTDAGATWNARFRFNGALKQLLIDSRNSEVMYAIAKDLLFKTIDNGKIWTQIEEPLEKFDGTKGIRRIYFDFGESDTVYIITSYGILRSRDGGAKWGRLKLLTPPKSVTIRDFAINPLNNKEMYYVVDNKVHKSVDGGVNWETSEIKTTSVITRLLIHPENPSILYAGLYFVEEK